MPVCFARLNGGEGRFPGNEVHELSAAQIPAVGIGNSPENLPIVVRVKPGAAEILLKKPGFDERCSREILFVGNRLGDKGAVVQLLAACFQLPPIFVPSAPSAPVFLGVKKREQGGKAYQHKETTTNHSPTEQPAGQPSEGGKMAEIGRA